MNTAEPIRELEELERFKNYYAYDYEYNTIGMIDVIRVASG